MVWSDPYRGATELPLEDLPTTSGAYIGAVASEAWRTAPVASILRHAERQQEEFGTLGAIERMNPAFGLMAKFWAEPLRKIGNAYPEIEATPGMTGPRSEIISKAEANVRLKELGLTVDRDTPESVIELLAQRRRQQLAAELVYKQARVNQDYGWGKGAASFFTDFFVQALDPLNLASSFLPITRAGMFVQTFGKGGAAFARGVLEGMAGAAAVEPILYGVQSQENPDYTLGMSITNILFGGAIGGGLHWTGGIMRRRSEGRREALAAKLAEIDREHPTAPFRAADEGTPVPPAERARQATASELDARERHGISDLLDGHAERIARGEIPPGEQRTAQSVENMTQDGKTAMNAAGVLMPMTDRKLNLDPIAKSDPQWQGPPPVAAADAAQRTVDRRAPGTEAPAGAAAIDKAPVTEADVDKALARAIGHVKSGKADPRLDGDPVVRALRPEIEAGRVTTPEQARAYFEAERVRDLDKPSSLPQRVTDADLATLAAHDVQHPGSAKDVPEGILAPRHEPPAGREAVPAPLERPDLQEFARRANDPREDMHADFAALDAQRAFLDQKQRENPMQDLQERMKAAGDILTPADKDQIKAVTTNAEEASKAVEVLAFCNARGGG